jgi:predicted RNA-binding Zn ribbon-like protein
MAEATRTLESLELVGGVLCLDFTNTINSRLYPEHDYLMQYSDLVGWAEKVGLLSPTQAVQLQKRANKRGQEGTAAVNEARRIRELLYRLFSNAAKGSEPDKKDMNTLVASYAEAISHGEWTKADDRYKTNWKVDEAFDSVLWPIVHSAGDLLQSEDLRHVKECPGCGWLFLDTSKNQSRRWCSMNTCGVRDKMRRYHKRKQTK